MAVGDWHELNGYRFRETLHGPMHEKPCGGCGHIVGHVLPSRREGDQPRDYPTEAMCSGCGRARHGAALPQRPSYPTVTVERHRLLPEQGGRVTKEAWWMERRNPDRVTCWWCSYPIDPATRTVEHPDRHPSCVSYPADAPMETPLEDS